MAKKKSEKKSVVKVVGTPTMLMLPARNYRFTVDETDYRITVPRRGKYVDIDPAIFSEEDGEFDILATTDEGHVILYFPSITKVLFGVSSYPDLKDNQAFTPIAIIAKDNEVDIIGNIIEMVEEQ